MAIAVRHRRRAERHGGLGWRQATSRLANTLRATSRCGYVVDGIDSRGDGSADGTRSVPEPEKRFLTPFPCRKLLAFRAHKLQPSGARRISWSGLWRWARFCQRLNDGVPYPLYTLTLNFPGVVVWLMGCPSRSTSPRAAPVPALGPPAACAGRPWVTVTLAP
jgi:hypothetical protein